MDLETALLNLLDNALRFSPEAGQVMVWVSSPASRDAISIAVSDQGPGIPEAHREKVFDRFFTTDADGEGTGLGLAIVRSVAAAHGGTAEVNPSQGEGTTVTVRLPVQR
jgi:two-component system sensor histidine kinase ChvG